MTAALGKKIQAKSVQGSVQTPSSPRRTSSCKTTFTPRDTREMTQNATPTIEKPFIAQDVDTQQPITTRTTGTKSHLLKVLPLTNITPKLTAGLVDAMISVRDTLQDNSAKLFATTDVEVAIAMGRILPTNSLKLGRSIGFRTARAL
mmetsp:Transcript_10856/g.23015  ORF Transcript_10856/g.23015 Transcript_10856/m.23015 type:complete len:147 (+) Transcript_10856:348-788(+)